MIGEKIRREKVGSVPTLSPVEDGLNITFILIYFKVTALICGFEAKVYTSLSNESFMKQLCQIGVLAEFECLLSTYGKFN